MMIVEAVYLHFQDGTSDKGYVSEVIQTEAGYLHHTAYGRRDGEFKHQFSKPYPNKYAAMDPHWKIVGQKLNKGYQRTTVQELTGYRPSAMLPGITAVVAPALPSNQKAPAIATGSRKLRISTEE